MRTRRLGRKMVFAAMAASIFVLVLSQTVRAENSEYAQFAGTLAGGGSTGIQVGIMTSNPGTAGVVQGESLQRFQTAWTPTPFRFDRPEMVFVEVIGPGNAYQGYSSKEWADWLRQSLISKLSGISRQSNFSMMSKGQPCPDDVIWRVSLKVVTGQELARESSSYTDSDSYRSRRGSSSSYRDKDSRYEREDSAMYMAAKVEIVRYLGNGREIVIAAPDIRVSASDGFQLSESCSSRSNNSYNYSSNKRGTSSSYQERESSSRSWEKDEEFEQAQQGDSLVNYLANGLVAAGTRALASAFQQDQAYGGTKSAGSPVSVTVNIK